MTADKPTLTPLAEIILEAVRASGDQWIGRSAIAQRIGRPSTLTPYDVDILKALAADGLIEVERKSTGVVRFEYLYRAK